MTSTHLSPTSLHSIDRGLPTERELADWRRRRDASRAARPAVRLPRRSRHLRLRVLRPTS